MNPVVLIHGGSFAASCWDLVVPLLEGPSLAVDLPGRGVHPEPPGELTIATASASVVRDIDAVGFDEVVLVGHSLAGCSMPATIGLLGERVRHAVFVACTVPEHGKAVVDTLPEEVQSMVRESQGAAPGVMDDELARLYFGNDLDDAQFLWCKQRMVPEGLTILTEPVSLEPLRSGVRRSWVRPLQDAIVDPKKQLQFAGYVGECPVTDIDAGHMCMISQPNALAALINEVAA